MVSSLARYGLLVFFAATASAAVFAAIWVWQRDTDDRIPTSSVQATARHNASQFEPMGGPVVSVRGRGDGVTGTKLRGEIDDGNNGSMGGGGKGEETPLARTATALSSSRMSPHSAPAVASDIAHLTARANGRGFRWYFDYPGPDGEFDTADDRQGEPTLRVPINSTVKLEITSSDYLYTFSIPELGLKQIAVPRLTHTLSFRADRAGQFDLKADPLCGFRLLHGEVMGKLLVVERKKFEAWRREG